MNPSSPYDQAIAATRYDKPVKQAVHAILSDLEPRLLTPAEGVFFQRQTHAELIGWLRSHTQQPMQPMQDLLHDVIRVAINDYDWYCHHAHAIAYIVRPEAYINPPRQHQRQAIQSLLDQIATEPAWLKREPGVLVLALMTDCAVIDRARLLAECRRPLNDHLHNGTYATLEPLDDGQLHHRQRRVLLQDRVYDAWLDWLEQGYDTLASALGCQPDSDDTDLGRAIVQSLQRALDCQALCRTPSGRRRQPGLRQLCRAAEAYLRMKLTHWQIDFAAGRLKAASLSTAQWLAATGYLAPEDPAAACNIPQKPTKADHRKCVRERLKQFRYHLHRDEAPQIATLVSHIRDLDTWDPDDKYNRDRWFLRQLIRHKITLPIDHIFHTAIEVALNNIQKSQSQPVKSETIAAQLGPVLIDLLHETQGQSWQSWSGETFQAVYERILEVQPTDAVASQARSGLMRLHAWLVQAYGVAALPRKHLAKPDLPPPLVRDCLIWPDDFDAIQHQLCSDWLTATPVEQALWLTATLAYRLGLRKSEVLRLRLRDIEISPQRGYVYIRAYGDYGYKSGNAERELPLHDLLLPHEFDQLRAWLDWIRAYMDPASTQRLFPYSGEYGFPSSDNAYADRIEKVARLVTGDPNVVFHTLRHSFVVLLILCARDAHYPATFGHSRIRQNLDWLQQAGWPRTADHPGLLGNDRDRFMYVAFLTGHLSYQSGLKSYFQLPELVVHEQLLNQQADWSASALQATFNLGRATVYKHFGTERAPGAPAITAWLYRRYRQTWSQATISP